MRVKFGSVRVEATEANCNGGTIRLDITNRKHLMQVPFPISFPLTVLGHDIPIDSNWCIRQDLLLHQSP